MDEGNWWNFSGGGKSTPPAMEKKRKKKVMVAEKPNVNVEFKEI